MSLELSDLNDNTILQATVQENDANGNIRFKITLQDGHPLVSEWLSPDNKKVGLFAWIDVVKQQALARVNEEQALKRRKALEIAASAVPTPPVQEPQEVQSMVHHGAGTTISSEQDPLDYAKEQLEKAQERADYWNIQVASATAWVTQYGGYVLMWTKIVETLEER